MRNKLLTIELTEGLERNQAFMNYAKSFGYDKTKGLHPNIGAELNGIKLDGKKIIWLLDYDQNILSFPVNIIGNLQLWYDNGEREIRVTTKNKNDYPINELYKDKLDTYIVELEI